jgi:hypothetical protein
VALFHLGGAGAGMVAQLKTVMLERFNNKPDIGDYDPAFRYNIFRCADRPITSIPAKATGSKCFFARSAILLR